MISMTIFVTPVPCQSGEVVVHHKRTHPGIVQHSTALGGLLLGMVADCRLSQEITIFQEKVVDATLGKKNVDGLY